MRACALEATLLLFAVVACTESRTLARSAVPDATSGSTAPNPRALVIFETGKGEVPIKVEVVDREEARNRGLMYRRTLPPDEGMLFLFPEEAVHSFWMRNTYLPLDLIFINGRMEVVGVVENATPLTDTPRMVWKPSRYAVEVNAHLARVAGIREGTRVRFEGVDSPLFGGMGKTR
jgi:uncharacterized membrane protein (UPF0127 family)